MGSVVAERYDVSSVFGSSSFFLSYPSQTTDLLQPEVSAEHLSASKKIIDTWPRQAVKDFFLLK